MHGLQQDWLIPSASNEASPKALCQDRFVFWHALELGTNEHDEGHVLERRDPDDARDGAKSSSIT